MVAIQFGGSAGSVIAPFVELDAGQGWAGDALRPAVAFNADDGSYLVVFQHRDSSSQGWNIYGNRLALNADGSYKTNGPVDGDGRTGPYRNRFLIGETLTTDEDSPHPDVAWGSAGNSFLAVWRYYSAPAYNIQARYIHDTHQSGDQTQGEKHRITPSVAYSGEPAVAYSASGNRYLVTFTYDSGAYGSDIYGQRMSASDSASPEYQNGFVVAQTSATETDSDVTYSPACGCFVVTYHHAAGKTYTLYAQQVRGIYNAAGQLDGDKLPVAQAILAFDAGAWLEGGRVACASDRAQCLAGWQINRMGLAVTNSDIRSQRIRCSESTPTFFLDDFGDPDSGWPTGETSNYRVAYTAGEYQVHAKNEDVVVLSTAPVECENCRIEVDARFEGMPNNGYGLVLAKEGDDYYALLAFPYADTCDLVKYTAGAGSLLSRQTCDLQHVPNHLRVDWQAPSIRTYVNGNLVHDLTDGAYSGVRDVGVLTYGQGDARFDNFAVSGLEAGAYEVYLPVVMRRP